MTQEIPSTKKGIYFQITQVWPQIKQSRKDLLNCYETLIWIEMQSGKHLSIYLIEWD